MSLTNAYSKAWQNQYGLPPGWFVNTEPTDTIPLGLKGKLIGDAFQQSRPLAQLTPLVPEPTAPDDHSAWQFQSSSGITVEAAIEGKTGTNIAWLAGAKAGVKATFGRESGVSALGTHKWFHRFSDMDAVRAQLRAAVISGDLVEGDAVVVERQLTGRGMVLASQGGGAAIQALASGEVAPAGAGVADFSGSFNVTERQGAVTMQEFGDGSVIAARIMHVGHRGLWWWRKIVVFGLEPLPLAQLEATALTPVEGDGPDEYFLLF